MNSIKNLLWNEAENRMRNGYRIIITVVLYLLFYRIYLFLINSLGIKLIYSSKSSLWIFLLGGSVRILPAILALWVSGRIIDKRRMSNFGFHLNKNWWTDFGFGFGLGAVLMSIIFLIELIFGWITIAATFYSVKSHLNIIVPLLVFLFLFICAGMAEEIFARGYLIKNLSEGFNLKSINSNRAILIALVLTSLIFGLAHLGNSNATLLSTFNIMMAGVLFGVGYIYTGQLAIPIGLHVSWNFFQANIFGWPVSGITYPAEIVSVIKTTQNGPDFITGGNFGPEGGLLGTFIFILGIIIIYIWLLLRNGISVIKFHDGLAKYTTGK